MKNLNKVKNVLEMNSLALQTYLNPLDKFFMTFPHSSLGTAFIVAVISVLET